MYVLLLALVIAGGIWLGWREDYVSRLTGRLLLIGGLAFFGLMSFVAELLWFQSLGYASRFWSFVMARVGTLLLGAGGALLLGYVLARPIGPLIGRGVAALSGIAGIIWAINSWQLVLLHLHGVDTGVREPLLGIDTGVYLFSLPFYDGIVALLLFVSILALLANLFLRETAGGEIRVNLGRRQQPDAAANRSLLVSNVAFALVAAFGSVLLLLHLLYSSWGIVQGPGWVDAQIRRPAMLLIAALCILAGLLPFWPAYRMRFERLLRGRLPNGNAGSVTVLGTWSATAGMALVIGLLLPGAVQWLVVKPNEITFEAPYITRNIEFTRRGFNLHRVEERAFLPSATFTQQTVDNNQHLLSEVRLWDWQALDAVYKQFQEIRLYYEFVDVDIDRYHINGDYRQVMISARELDVSNLPRESQTFVNRRFKYTHGYGYTMAPVSEFTEDGLPDLLVRDIPPVAQEASLKPERSEIYYGELTREPVVVNTREPEFDYPSGESNVYTRYSGEGGVVMSNFWRRLIYGWKFDGTVLLLSSYPTQESRVLFRRQIRKRVAALAPFLELDQDPYVVAAQGRLYWIIDAYTRSNYYPYSRRFDSLEYIETREDTFRSRAAWQLDGANYVRNSVKVVVDAYHGDATFYVFDDEDPIVQTWRGIVPGLFKSAAEMPAAIRSHVRYPHDFLLTQGLVYSRYHMTDPAVFYNQEDLWVRATEKHYDTIRPVDPYYVMWELPGSDEAEFGLILPFTPKNRQVLIGWIAGLSDGDNYGRFLAYKFPKEKRVIGPQQVETKLDQDSFLSGQLTLWNQQGSEVIRGNVLAIPVDDSLIYVEPIYLKAETAAYPELRLVAVMHGDELSYAETFAEALQGLLGTAADDQLDGLAGQELARQANRSLTRYLEATGDGRFEDAARALQRLRETLDRLNASWVSNDPAN